MMAGPCLYHTSPPAYLRSSALSALLRTAHSAAGGAGTGRCGRTVATGGVRAGEAAYITFDPLASEPVPLPDDCQFVVAHSTRVSNKAETAVVHYNLRVVECRLAAIMLAIRLGYPISEARHLRTLHVRRRCFKGVAYQWPLPCLRVNVRERAAEINRIAFAFTQNVSRSFRHGRCRDVSLH